MINNVVLVGRLTGDAKESTRDSRKFIYGSIAQNYGTKEREQTQFVDFFKEVKADSKLATYLKKGTLVCIIGSLVVSDKADKNDATKKVRRYSIRVDHLEMLSSKEAGGETDSSTELPF